MAKLYYCGMAEQNGKPKLGQSARLLGVRPTIDINIEQMPMGCLDEQGYLLPESQRKLHGDLVTVAIRDTKGMSVSLSIVVLMRVALTISLDILREYHGYYQMVSSANAERTYFKT